MRAGPREPNTNGTFAEGQDQRSRACQRPECRKSETAENVQHHIKRSEISAEAAAPPESWTGVLLTISRQLSPTSQQGKPFELHEDHLSCWGKGATAHTPQLTASQETPPRAVGQGQH